MKKYDPVLGVGPKYVSGFADRGQIILIREDGTTDETPIFALSGITITDNGDGTATLTMADEE